MSRMMLRSPRAFFMSSIASAISADLLLEHGLFGLRGSPIFFSDEWPTMTASQSPVTIFEKNFSRAPLRSPRAWPRALSPGYRRANSSRHWSVR
jgi:hypothetical protein